MRGLTKSGPKPPLVHFVPRRIQNHRYPLRAMAPRPWVCTLAQTLPVRNVGVHRLMALPCPL